MLKAIRHMILFSLIALFGSQTASADVIFTFTQAGPTMQTPFGGLGEPVASPITARLGLTVSDDAFAAGLNLNQRNDALFRPPFADLNGLVALYVGLDNLMEAFSASVDDFTRPIPILAAGYSRISLTSAPNGLPVGSVLFSTAQYITVQFLFDGSSAVLGSIVGDGSCFSGCTFSGVLTTTVPEPASILTFAMGVLALGAARRTRRA